MDIDLNKSPEAITRTGSGRILLSRDYFNTDEEYREYARTILITPGYEQNADSASEFLFNKSRISLETDKSRKSVETDEEVLATSGNKARVNRVSSFPSSPSLQRGAPELLFRSRSNSVIDLVTKPISSTVEKEDTSWRTQKSIPYSKN